MEIDIPDPKVEEEAEELYFEVFNIQPMRLNLSFVRTERINASPLEERYITLHNLSSLYGLPLNYCFTATLAILH
jgi:hypothetical protein